MRKPSRLLAISVLAFVVLGMPKSAFGVAWPSVAGTFRRPLAELGVAITVYVAGYFLATLTSGDLGRYLRPGRLLSLAGWLATAMLAGYAVAPSWPFLLVCAVGLGFAGGWIDAGINAHVAQRHGARAMGFLHAGFGAGATLGPALMTALVGAGTSWRLGFAGLAAAQGILAAAFVRTRHRWGLPEPAGRRPARPRLERRMPLVLALTVFALYSGVEVGAGQWAFTLLSEGRGLDTGVAGLAVAAFWAALTAARLGLGLMGDRISPVPIVTASAVAALAGAATLWWNPVDWVGLTGLIVMGFALGPIFPLQTTLTPQRSGVAYTPVAVGYQLAAATAGAAVLPGGLGLLVAWQGLEVVAAVLTIASGLLVVSIETLRRV